MARLAASVEASGGDSEAEVDQPVETTNGGEITVSELVVAESSLDPALMGADT